jgi:hypothetical protein
MGRIALSRNADRRKEACNARGDHYRHSRRADHLGKVVHRDGGLAPVMHVHKYDFLPDEQGEFHLPEEVTRRIGVS